MGGWVGWEGVAKQHAQCARRQQQPSTPGSAPGPHGPPTLKAPAMICSSSSKYIATCTTTGRCSQLAQTGIPASEKLQRAALPGAACLARHWQACKPHLNATLLHNVILAVQHMLGLPPQPLLHVALQVLNHTPVAPLEVEQTQAQPVQASRPAQHTHICKCVPLLHQACSSDCRQMLQSRTYADSQQPHTATPAGVRACPAAPNDQSRSTTQPDQDWTAHSQAQLWLGAVGVHNDHVSDLNGQAGNSRCCM